MIKKAAVSAALNFFKKHKKLLIVMNLIAILMPLFVVLNMLEAAQSVLDAITGGTGEGNSGVAETWDGVGDSGQMYEEEDLAKWNGGKYGDDNYGSTPQDPNQTAKIYQKMKEEKESFSTYLNSDERTDSKDAWARFLSEDHSMFSTGDMQYIYEQVYKYNNRMFEKNIIKYQYEQWSIEDNLDDSGNPTGTYHWNDGVEETDTDLDAGEGDAAKDVRGHVTRENIEGEKVDGVSDKRKFAVNWQDVMAVSMLRVFDDSKTWGNQEKRTEYDYGIESSTPEHVNSTNNYFLTKKGSDGDAPGSLDKIIDFFDYDFYYKYDAVTDMSAKDNAYAYDTETDTLLTGKKIGFRMYNESDPEDKYATLYTKDIDPIPYTKFVPESAPEKIINGWEAYYYKYIPVSDVPEDKRECFGWDENGSLPDGEVCIGRWHIVDPTAFIDGVSEAITEGKASYYEKRGADEKYVEESGYDWEAKMIEHVNMYLEILPFNNATQPSRTGRMNEMLQMYKDKKLIVYYEGTPYDGMEAKGESLLHELLDTRVYGYYRSHYLKIGKSEDEAGRLADEEVLKWKENSMKDDSHGKASPDLSGVKEYFPVSRLYDPDTMPFYSYGVIYGNPSLTGSGQNGENGGNTVPEFHDNDELRSEGFFWIWSHGGKEVSTDFHYYSGSNVHFASRKADYDATVIKAMLDDIYEKAKKAGKESTVEGINSDESLHTLMDYYERSGHADIIAMLAIAYIETGGLHKGHGAEHWNYFNLAGSSADFTYERSGRKWYDVKSIVKAQNPNATPADALVYGMERRIMAKYWDYGQDTYLLMQFAGYGKKHPKNETEAQKADKDPGYTWEGHAGEWCYCPWWDGGPDNNPWYYDLDSEGRHQDKYMWCNQVAFMYLQLLNTYGANRGSYDPNAYGAWTPSQYNNYVNSLSGFPWAQALLREAGSHIGAPYTMGAGHTGPDKFDCSGFVWYCNKQCGYTSIGYETCDGLWDDLTDPISDSEVLPGDIIYFTGTQPGTNKVRTHIGIVVDPVNKIMVAASSSHKQVTISSYNTEYWRKHFYGFARVKNRGSQR